MLSLFTKCRYPASFMQSKIIWQGIPENTHVQILIVKLCRSNMIKLNYLFKLRTKKTKDDSYKDTVNILKLFCLMEKKSLQMQVIIYLAKELRVINFEVCLLTSCSHIKIFFVFGKICFEQVGCKIYRNNL